MTQTPEKHNRPRAGRTLTDRNIGLLACPHGKTKQIHWDNKIAGFGLRVTAGGSKSWILDYRLHGRQRQITIGDVANWPTEKAREEAGKLRREIDIGNDPLDARHAKREGLTIGALCDDFEREYLPRKRPSTQSSYRSLLSGCIRPRLEKITIGALTHTDVRAFHSKVAADTPIRANRAIAVLSKIVSLAVRDGLRADNPCKGIERSTEKSRVRYLSADELSRLSEALERELNREMVDAIRLLLLTGARRSEVLLAPWSQFDLDTGVWAKPPSSTKQKRMQMVPLNGAALEILRRMKDGSSGALLFPDGPKNFERLRATWKRVLKDAKIADLRAHDLRHSFASIVASAGGSLPVIGALLGHIGPATTQRYAHLFDNTLGSATDMAGLAVGGAKK